MKYIGIPIGFLTVMIIQALVIDTCKLWWIMQLSGLLFTILLSFETFDLFPAMPPKSLGGGLIVPFWYFLPPLYVKRGGKIMYNIVVVML